MSKTMRIMRGVPGSGKSFLADSFMRDGYVILSTDDIYEDRARKEYLWSFELLGLAHKMNQMKADLACRRDIPLILIDNTNTTYKECKPYLDMAKKYGYEIVLTEPETDWFNNAAECFKRNSHGVPLETIQRMIDRYEDSADILEKHNAANSR